MAQDTLSDKAIKAKLKEAVAAGKANTLNDGGGLRLIARPDGSGWWRFRYWIDKKEGLLSLGIYPDVSLSMARQSRDEARRMIAAGIDPSTARKEAKATHVATREADKLAAAGLPPIGSFEQVAREWLATVHQAKVSAIHSDRTQVRFEKDVFPWIGRRPIGDIEAPELLDVLRRIEARGAIETAHRAKDAAGQVFRYGIATGRCTRNPAADLRDALRPVQTTHLAAIIDPAQAGKLLRDMADYQGHAVTRAALGLSALLLLRPGELRHMEWAWLDLEAATLTVPSEVMKRKKADKQNGPPHLVPLATQAVTILQDLHPLTGAGRFVFPALTSSKKA
jgi:hypothetical protein